MEWNAPKFVKENIFIESSRFICVCCLARNVKLIYLKTCVHSTLLTIFFGNMLKDNDLVCLNCHKVLLNFHTFKLQVERSIRELSQVDSNLPKLHILKTTAIDTYDIPDIPSEDLPGKGNTLKRENNTLKIENQSLNHVEDDLHDDNNIIDSIEEENITVHVKQELSASDLDEKQQMPIKSELKRRCREHGRRRQHKKKYSSKCKVNSKRVNVVKKDEHYEATNSFVLSMKGETLRYSCEHCGRMFQWKCHLKRHIAGAHVSGKLQCAFCAKVFKNDLSLSRHVKYIHERKEDISDAGPVQCPICLNMFKMKKTLHVHLKRMHRPDTGKEEERYCVECNKLFKSKVYYELHLKTALKHVADRYECHDCGKKFTVKGYLAEHIKRLHLRTRRHACGVCGKLFFKEHLRRLHERHSHLGVPRQRNHVCSVCGKAFTCSQVLKRHVIIHSGVKPFQCARCPSKFSQKSTLKTHCKFKHKDALPSPS